MKLLHIFEASEDDLRKYRQWQKECRLESKECQFTGTCSNGAQAVDWSSSDSRAVGDWDGKTKTGVVYSQRS